MDCGWIPRIRSVLVIKSMDPLTIIALLQALAQAQIEFNKYLQTPAGQNTANTINGDLTAVHKVFAGIGDTIKGWFSPSSNSGGQAPVTPHVAPTAPIAQPSAPANLPTPISTGFTVAIRPVTEQH